ncbi:MAG: hypothetical protein AAF802_21940 [Planctomycetota bacterium]
MNGDAESTLTGPRRWGCLPAALFVLHVILLTTTSWIAGFRFDLDKYYRGRYEVQVFPDAGRLLVKTLIGTPFSPARAQYHVIDTRKRRHVHQWTETHDRFWYETISDDGSTVLLQHSRDQVAVRRADPQKSIRVESAIPYDRSWRFADQDTIMLGTIYDDSDCTVPVVYDIASESSLTLSIDRKIDFREHGRWLTDNLFVVYRRPDRRDFYQRDENQFVRLQLDIDVDPYGFEVLHGKPVLLFPADGLVFDYSTGVSANLQRVDRRGLFTARNSEVILFKRRDLSGENWESVAWISEKDGLPYHSVEFEKPVDSGSSLFVIDEHVWSVGSSEVMCFDRSGKLVYELISFKGTWVRWMIVLMAVVVVSWVTFTWTSRRKDARWSGVVSTLLLLASVFVPATVRLLTESDGLLLTEPESTAFFGATLSLATLVSFWFFFGRLSWPHRFTTALLVIAVTVGAYIWLWYGRGGFGMSMLAPAFVLSVAIWSGLTYLFGFRLVHASHASPASAWTGKRIQISQLIVWTFAFAILFGVSRQVDEYNVNWEAVGKISVQGTASGIAAVLVFCATLLPRKSWLWITLSMLTTAGFCWGLNQGLGKPPSWDGGDLFHPAGGFLSLFIGQTILLLAAGWSLRINGYRWSRRRADGPARVGKSTSAGESTTIAEPPVESL